MKEWDPSGKQGPRQPMPDLVTVLQPKEEEPISDKPMIGAPTWDDTYDVLLTLKRCHVTLASCDLVPGKPPGCCPSFVATLLLNMASRRQMPAGYCAGWLVQMM